MDRSAFAAIGRALLGTAVRKLLTIAGAFVVAHGFLDQRQADAFISPLGDELVGYSLVVLALGWSLLRTWLTHSRLAAAWAALKAIAAAERPVDGQTIARAATEAAAPGSPAGKAPLVLLLAVLGLVACAPLQSAGGVAAQTRISVGQAQRDYAGAKAIADLLAPSLSATRQEQLRTIEAIAEQALSAARVAVTVADQISALEQARGAIAQLQAVALA